MDGEQQGYKVPAAGDSSVAGGDSAANNDRPPDTTQDKSPQASPRRRSRKQKRWLIGILVSAVVSITVAAIAVIPSLLTSDRSSGSGAPGQPQVQVSSNNGQVVGGRGVINNYGPITNGGGLSSNPQAQIVQLTGSFSVQGFHDAIDERETNVVALYLQSGAVNAATLYKGASAILFGFQGPLFGSESSSQSGDPVALVKTFQAGGFKVNDELTDSYLMGALTDNIFPLMFNTNLTPQGYTGGYQGGIFVGSLLFWIVQRALGTGPSDQDVQVIKYLVSQGADCKVPLSFMEFNSNLLEGLSTGTYKELLPMMQSCAK